MGIERNKMIKHFHELTNQEFLWLVKEGITYAELNQDFPQPLWCDYHQAVFGMMGCWTLTNFSSGHSRVRGEDSCRDCDCFKPFGGKKK